MHRLDGLRSRPALADPIGTLTVWKGTVAARRERARRAALACVAEAGHDVGRLSARVTALSPEATLQRGYAVVQREDGSVVCSADEVSAGDALSARVATGRIAVTVSA
jgi:exodeoxyribonuclease VII large subunit